MTRPSAFHNFGAGTACGRGYGRPLSLTHCRPGAQALRNMTIGHFETEEHQGGQRAWRCTIAVPYTHIPLEQAHARHARRGEQTAVRDMGAFFMGARPAAPG